MGSSDIAVFRPPWKLIIRAIGREPELYDIVEDPYEKKNISKQNQAMTKELSEVGQAMIAMAEVSSGNSAGGRGRRSGRRQGNGPARE